LSLLVTGGLPPSTAIISNTLEVFNS